MIEILKDNAQWFIVISIITFIATLLLVPAIIIRLPANYFSSTKRQQLDNRHPAIKTLTLIIQNILGAILLLAGFIMLFTPGQGLITILAGMLIMNYPGKFKLERWIIIRFNLLKPINWYRKKHHIEPLFISTT